MKGKAPVRLVWKNQKQKITRREFQLIKDCLRARFDRFGIFDPIADINKLLVKLSDLENRVWDDVQRDISDLRKPKITKGESSNDSSNME